MIITYTWNNMVYPVFITCSHWSTIVFKLYEFVLCSNVTAWQLFKVMTPKCQNTKLCRNLLALSTLSIQYIVNNNWTCHSKVDLNNKLPKCLLRFYLFVFFNVWDLFPKFQTRKLSMLEKRFTKNRRQEYSWPIT